jgi:2-polyprenyl-3-methyl-5-hydroxy-6-metoxy-1,4-benzoquinol methylase
MKVNAEHIKEEAEAFDKRISARVRAGFIPDLRLAQKCDYFYKSFWRDPHFIDLYLGKINQNYLKLLKAYSHEGASILDVGCGAGYMSIEIARNGYHITAFDISSECISEANKVLAENPFLDNFGSLNYSVHGLHEASGIFDVVLFSVSLHHMPDLYGALEKAKELLKPGGILLCYEPCHDQWRESDAAQVALMRLLLSMTGHWFENINSLNYANTPQDFEKYVNEVLIEYVEERDKNEAVQSPHDNEATGAEMLNALRSSFEELHYEAGHSFIYRMLGGVRGLEEVITNVADLLGAYDQYSVKKGFMNPNGFYFVGKKIED